MSPISELRTQLSSTSNYQFVSADVYVALLTSHGAFERDDVPAANLYGLRDQTTGTRIVIPVEELSSRLNAKTTVAT